MKIAYVGDFVNYGKFLQPTGTSIVILLSMIDEVDSIDVYCPEQNENIEDFILPHNVRFDLLQQNLEHFSSILI
ncbi:MAG: hypothetical protein QXU18_05425 [Thermoplasmatales archaeon]